MRTRRCSACGRSVESHDRQVRFQLPDPVLELPDQLDTPGVWTSHGDPVESVMMQVPNLGAFLRALLKVELTGGHTVTYGVWVGISPTDLHQAFEIWWEPAYADLQLKGRLANAIEPWGLLGAPVDLEVRDVDQTPWCTHSDEQTLSSVITRTWDHDVVLSTLPE